MVGFNSTGFIDMLQYCETFTMVKAAYSNSENTELPSQEPVLPHANLKNERTIDERGELVVESVEKLSTKPGDLALYRSVGSFPKALRESETKLAKISNRTRNMISHVKPQSKFSFESELTFAPKLNATSIKLAKERNERTRTLLERKKEALYAETESKFTFHPNLSSNSVRIMQNLKTTFLDRQQMHVERQKRYIEGLINPHQNSKSRLMSPVPNLKSPTIKVSSRAASRKLFDVEERASILEENFPSSSSMEGVTTSTVSTSVVELTSLSSIECSVCSLVNSNNEKTSPNSSYHSTNLEETSSNSDTLNKCSRVASKNSPENLEKIEQLKAVYSPNRTIENIQTKRQKKCDAIHKRRATDSQSKSQQGEQEAILDDSAKVEKSPKSKMTAARASSQNQCSRFGGKMKYDDPLFEKVRQAKEVSERAMKNKKVFVCHGPYPIVRAALRRRGWVEKHFVSSKKKKRCPEDDGDSCDDSCDDSDDDVDSDASNSPRCKVTGSRVKIRKKTEDNDGSCGDGMDDANCEQWLEEDWSAGTESGPDCEYSLMSRMVRNAVESLIWTCRRDDIDFKYLRKEQIANHYARAYSFTTKVGLCVNLRNLKWYEDAESNSFFPRCHRIGSDDEKDDFVDDFRLTAAINIVKWVVSRYEFQTEDDDIKEDQTAPRENNPTDSEPQESPRETSRESTYSRASAKRKGTAIILPVRVLTISLDACRQFISSKEHFEVDADPKKSTRITEETWEMIVQCFYQITHEGAIIASAFPFFRECQNVLEQIREILPQIDIDGTKNVWIVKPGAKSRGRGIMCMDRLEDILKLVGTVQGKKEGRWIVQKYIERPLLIYGAKFDIRQWFLVTEWNPLTLWFYKDCYLRFCSQNFTLDNYDVSIHLANNSVQKHYKNGIRDKRLPDDNMWANDDFQTYMKKRDIGHLWDERVYPGMKQAIIYALEACQEIPEYRKNSFELYGADFMLGEDYKPWLIEINCSPAMSPSTPVTRRLCAQVIEDTMKVVLDRREDKNCDTGRFELAYKQPFISPPPYIGVNLTVEGQAIKKTGPAKKQCSTIHVSLPKSKEKNIITPGIKDKGTPLDSNNKATGDNNCKDTPLHSHIVNTPDNSDKNPPPDSNTADIKKQEDHKIKNINLAKTSGKCCSKLLGAGIPENIWTTGYCANAMQKKYSVLVDDAKFRKKDITNERIMETRGFSHTPRVMAIPKAILRYSSAKTFIPQSSVSIAFSTSTKQV